jgi:hypothetical protein
MSRTIENEMANVLMALSETTDRDDDAGNLRTMPEFICNANATAIKNTEHEPKESSVTSS